MIKAYFDFIKKIGFDVKAAFLGSTEYPYDERSETFTAFPINYEFALKNRDKFYPDFDKDGIPVANYLNSGIQYNPTRIASYGLANYNLAVFNSDKTAKQEFIKIADWFANKKDNLFYYNYNYESLKAPWLSSMAQGQGISVLIRAYKLTSENKYLMAAQNACKPFLGSVEQGGVLDFIDKDTPILEEFPFKKNSWHVLNGFIYALIGIIELSEIDKTLFPEKNLQELLQTAEKGYLWTQNNWTCYDLLNFDSKVRNTATVNYHRVHIAQYKYLSKKYPDRDFIKWATIWSESYKKPLKRLQALLNKTKFRLSNPAKRF